MHGRERVRTLLIRSPQPHTTNPWKEDIEKKGSTVLRSSTARRRKRVPMINQNTTSNTRYNHNVTDIKEIIFLMLPSTRVNLALDVASDGLHYVQPSRTGWPFSIMFNRAEQSGRSPLCSTEQNRLAVLHYVQPSRTGWPFSIIFNRAEQAGRSPLCSTE